MAEKLNPFYKLLKAEVPINITSKLKETFDSVNKALGDACELALKQTIPGKQLVLMTDASFRSAGYALMIEDNPDQKIQSKRKTYAPVAFGSEVFSPAQLKMSIYSKEFLAIYMAFLEFAHILWETPKPTIVLKVNKSVTRFFQTKAIPPSLWNACDYVLQFNFKIALIAGSANTAADFLSRLELKVPAKIHLKIREDVQTTSIEVSTSSSTTLISDKGTAFTSHVIKEVVGVLGITLKHANTKHAQTFGLLERPHASIKQSLRIETGERRSLWQKYVIISVLNYNTSYHGSISCEPSRVFHGRIPYNILDLKMGIRPRKIPPPDSQIAQDVFEQTEAIFQDVRKSAMQTYIKYKAYYDRKANASRLKQADYVCILQPKADHQRSKIPFTDFRWIGPYIIEKVLPNNNYLVL